MWKIILHTLKGNLFLDSLHKVNLLTKYAAGFSTNKITPLFSSFSHADVLRKCVSIGVQFE